MIEVQLQLQNMLEFSLQVVKLYILKVSKWICGHCSSSLPLAEEVSPSLMP